jgi:sodium transport system permease protein
MTAWWTVYQKELLELRRDPKALLVTLGLPALLMPLLFLILSLGLEENSDWLARDVPFLAEGVDSRTLEFLKETGRFDLLSGSAEITRLLSGEAALLLCGSEATYVIRYDSRSQRSLAAAEVLRNLLEELGRRSTLSVRLYPAGESGAGGSGALLLSMTLPLLLLVASAVTPLASAADLGAGEKERGTLEPLLTTRVSRSALLLGKVGALWLMAIAGTLSFLAGTALAYLVAPEVFNLSFEWALFTPGKLLTVATYTLVMGLTFAAVELCLSLLAKTVREAQSFFLPLLILAVAAGYGTLSIDPLYVGNWGYLIPVANLALAVKGSVLGSLELGKAAVTLLSSGLYASVPLFLGFKQLHREAIVAGG